MNVDEIERDLSRLIHIGHDYKKKIGWYCVYCARFTDTYIMSKLDPDYAPLFNHSPYYTWAIYLRYKDDTETNLPTGEIRWFCSISCLAHMIKQNEPLLLEFITK